MHCYLEAHMDIGMAVVLQVGEISEQPKPPKNFPKCSNFNGEPLFKPKSKDNYKSFLQFPSRQDLFILLQLSFFILDVKKRESNKLVSGFKKVAFVRFYVDIYMYVTVLSIVGVCFFIFQRYRKLQPKAVLQMIQQTLNLTRMKWALHPSLQ